MMMNAGADKTIQRIAVPTKKAAIEPSKTIVLSAERTNALRAIKETSAPAKKRVEFLERMKKLPLYSGTISISGERVRVKDGRFAMAGNVYLVSKDGRAILNKDGILVGEVTSGVVRRPSARFMREMVNLGIGKEY